ncbi:hypothetical protein IQ260_20690 [Leptolyngbya cf. ectocarpi LEGE 11479]|uniref:Uncharacterized protein n=1 Tax=Leptolyngbya cf. ectocarpi LEGE 11479 TaxID=1828722 RepID=A0A929FBF1_LEPEC|nr:hypothetical protein [Leptolyngbya ectocarpi]MBE9069067.1 hypothetical protein [Leptolyngbya cf. ectocarpi LEGE 11479]
MTLLIIAIVTGLVVWALRLMDRALVSQEFSLMLAGFLVASSAAAMVGVYFLMSDYMVYINQSELRFQDQYTSDFMIFDERISSAQSLESELISLEIANLTEDVATSR